MRPMDLSTISHTGKRPSRRTADVPVHASRFVFAPHPVRLSAFTLLRREPVRPLDQREPDFADRYDDDTLIYDAVRTGRGDEVLLLAPPLLNLEESMERAKLYAMPSRTLLDVAHQPMDRHARLRVHVPPATTHLLLDAPFGKTDIAISPARTGLFAGLRTIFTKSKNNDLQWIRDWVCYHRDIHGAEAVLIYDNGSTAYTAHDLAAMLSTIGGLKQAIVVSWPFRFGPQGKGDGSCWDSDYCEFGIWEHARWTFLREAKSVLGSDIDELVITPPGRTIFELAESAPAGVLRYYGRWAYGIEGKTPPRLPGIAPRHRDFTIACKPQMKRRFGLIHMDAAACFAKWACVPGKCPDKAQWHTHTIKNMLAARLFTNKVHFLHFREISNSWKYDRSARHGFDPAIFEQHQRFAAHVAQVDWDR